ncbi:hypothetical protein [Propionibacterium acidifaciens]|uniref:hypothetical protein n=1 Tax=Propionibacterium acidifaciens TaxID=556499 RepID=UPI00361A0A15
MPDLVSQTHPNLLVTSPRIEFSDGTASCDTELTNAQLAHLATLGVTLAGRQPEDEQDGQEETEEAGSEQEQAAPRRRRKTDG